MQEFTSQTELKKITDNTIYTPPPISKQSKDSLPQNGKYSVL